MALRSIAGPLGPRATTGGGGRNNPPPQAFGGGGGGRGDGDGFPDPAERLRRYRIGLYFAIAFTVMVFVSLTSLFVALRTSGSFDPLSGHYVMNWASLQIPFPILFANALIILASSLCMEMARRKAALECVLVPATEIPGLRREPRYSRFWVSLTIVLGGVFLSGQALAWRAMGGVLYASRTIAARSFVYLLTGTHAIHLSLGMLVLTYGLIAPLPRRSCDSWRITVDLTALYWHFIAVLWGYVLIVLWALH
jgi:cytochrome c oxidase subunit 3